MRPSLGRIVHYRHPNIGSRAAIITRVLDEDTVELTVFYTLDDGPPGFNSVGQFEAVQQGDQPGQWCEPPRV